MDFLAMASELELKTIERYRTMAERCSPYEGIHRILNMLISDHESHLASLQALQDEGGSDLGDLKIFSEIKLLLEKMKSDKAPFSCSIDQLQLYREAHDLVLEKQALYQKIRSGLAIPASQDRLDRLIQEESKQALILENIIRMVERPEQWLEDAEFSHLDEY